MYVILLPFPTGQKINKGELSFVNSSLRMIWVHNSTVDHRNLVFNPFTAKGFPIDEYNRLALDRVKSVSFMRAPTAVKVLNKTKVT